MSIKAMCSRLAESASYCDARAKVASNDDDRLRHHEKRQKILSVINVLSEMTECKPVAEPPPASGTLKQMLALMDERPGKATRPFEMPRMPSYEEAALALACYLIEKGDGAWDKEAIKRRRQWRDEMDRIREAEAKLAQSIRSEMHRKVREYGEKYGVLPGDHKRK